MMKVMLKRLGQGETGDSMVNWTTATKRKKQLATRRNCSKRFFGKKFHHSYFEVLTTLLSYLGLTALWFKTA